MYSSEVYARLCKTSYEYEELREKVITELLGDMFQIVPEYTNRDILTVREGDMYTVALRGTDLVRDPYRAFSDLFQDVNIAIGKNDRVYRIDQASAVLQEMFKHISKERIILTGHSLGGFVGANLAERYQMKAVLFNIGCSPLDAVGVRRGLKNITHYTTNNLGVFPPVIDVLSVSSLFIYRFPYYIVPVKSGLSKHTIENFI